MEQSPVPSLSNFNLHSLLHNPKYFRIVVLVGLILILLLVILVIRQTQTLGVGAALPFSATLSLTPTAISVAPNQTFEVRAGVDSGGQPIIGTDLVLSFDPNGLLVTNIVLPALSNSLRTFTPLNSTTGLPDVTKVISDANQTGKINISTVTFDWPSNNTTTEFSGAVNPLATITFQAKSTATGAYPISYDFSSTGQAGDSNVVAIEPTSQLPVDILQAPTSVALVTIIVPPTTTPIPFPTPIPTRTPTPTPPSSNAKPSVFTDSLPNARVNRAYQIDVEAFDPNPTNTLKLTASTLPTGLTLSSCSSKVTNGQVRLQCQLKGTPTRTGTTNITFTVTDNLGASSTRQLRLVVTN